MVAAGDARPMKMRICLVCQKTIFQTKTGGRVRDYCSHACWLAWCRAKRAGAKRRVFKVREELLGPDIPLDGVSEEERDAQRQKRIIQALLDGVMSEAVCERFGIGLTTVSAIRVKHGISPEPGFRLPFGVPVP